jgi:hypothetical protein
MQTEIIIYVVVAALAMIGLFGLIAWLIDHIRMRNETRCLNFANWLLKNARKSRDGYWVYLKNSGEYSTYDMYNFWRDSL